MTTIGLDAASAAAFSQIDQWASKYHGCKACGIRYRSLTPLSFCPTCLSSLYVQGK